MGTFTDNLLKLTEFPFSYSLISLLTLILLGEGLLEQPPERLAPLLILMSFVATTLSMTDPIGVLIKEGLYGFRGRVSFAYDARSFIFSRSLRKITIREDKDPWNLSGDAKEEYNQKLVDMMIKTPMFRRRLSDAFYLSAIPHTMLVCLSPNYRDIFSSIHYRRAFFEAESFLLNLDQLEHTLKELKIKENEEIFAKLLSLKKSSLGTAWMVREIDKSTAMVYFLIVVALLISALISDQFFNASFLDKFLDIFQGNEQASEEAKSQAKEQARFFILGLSGIFFIAVLYKLIKRLWELRSKALINFEFILEREVIKIEANKKEEKDTFDKYLQEIERYFMSGDWTLAELSVRRVMKEYDDFIRREWIEKKEIPGRRIKKYTSEGKPIYE